VGAGRYALLNAGQQLGGHVVPAPAAPPPSANREKRFLLAAAEQRALVWMAERMPARVMPDHLTALAMLGAVGIAAAYVLSNGGRGWLWAASALLLVHWLGDSLDGTLARVRKTERPNYGYYLDHLCDALAMTLIGAGLGLSPHLLLLTSLVIVVAYLVLCINTFLETQALGRFSLGYGGIGPTELRLVLVAVNVALALGAGLGFEVAGLGLTVLDVFGLGVAGVMLAALGVRAASNLRVLAAREPAQATWRAAAPLP